MEANKDSLVRIGYVNACIAGDRRYSSKLEVFIDQDTDVDGSGYTTAEVRLSETSPVGGMDGPGGSHPFRVTAKVGVRVDRPQQLAAAIVKALKRAMDPTIKRYGKPTKSFVWETGEHGLSVDRCQRALNGGE